MQFSARVRGRGTIMLFRSSGRGLFEPAGTIDVHAPTRATTVRAELDMTGLMDGGFFWFDAKAGDGDDLTIEDAAWSVPVEARRGGDGTL